MENKGVANKSMKLKVWEIKYWNIGVDDGNGRWEWKI